MMVRIALATGLALLGGCSSVEVHGSGDDGDCTSHYERVADARSRAALQDRLLHLDRRAHDLRLLEHEGDTDKTVVNVLNRRGRLISSLDMWQRHDGTWTAQRWSQCIDS